MPTFLLQWAHLQTVTLQLSSQTHPRLYHILSTVPSVRKIPSLEEIHMVSSFHSPIPETIPPKVTWEFLGFRTQQWVATEQPH